MSRYGSENPLIYQMRKNNLNQRCLARSLGVGDVTIGKYVKNPQMLSLGQLIAIAGLFGMSVEELVYLLVRFKPKVDGKLHKGGKWHIQYIRDKHKE